MRYHYTVIFEDEEPWLPDEYEAVWAQYYADLMAAVKCECSMCRA